MKYHNHLNYTNRKKSLLKFKIAVWIFGLLVVAGTAFFYAQYIRDKDKSPNSPNISGTATSVIAPSVNIFKTPFFQFQANEKWVEVTNESNSSKFVYRGLRSNLIEHELTIYVNQIPANLEANRVLPVTMATGRTELLPEAVSEHCLKTAGGSPSINSPVLTSGGVTFRCDSDSTDYTVLVGEINKDTVLNMLRPDGTQVSFGIRYLNLRAVQDSVELIEIMKTFQTR